MIEDTYTFTFTLRDKKVNFRKWKVKDKKKFMENKRNTMLTKEALVYDCIEDKRIALSEEEYKYVLMKIREESVQEKVSYLFTCSACAEDFLYQADLNEIMKPEFKKYTDIVYKNHIFTISSIKNKEFYEEAMRSTTVTEERMLIDFILHVNAYNDNDGLSFSDINDIIINLDIDAFENIFKQWEEMRFKVNNVHAVKCPNCGVTEDYEFDDLPGFFPDSWNINA